jgi:hypothetical protein
LKWGGGRLLAISEKTGVPFEITGNMIRPIVEIKIGGAMVTAFVQFKIPAPLSREQAKEVFMSTASKYRQALKLIRKYYLLSEDGGTAGGVYLWQSREDTESLYTEEWKNFVKEKYGAEPTIVYFQTPVVVDNLTREIIRD